MSRPGILAVFVVSLALGLPASLALAGADAEAPPDDAAKYAPELQGFVPGAQLLEGRIMAPCCWTQTIDIHGSEVATDLRLEIRRRLKKGETTDAIEASLVERYGAKILAVPPGSPLKALATLMALAMGGAGAAGFVMLKRWREKSRATGSDPAPEKGPNDAQLDARLDAELKALDD